MENLENKEVENKENVEIVSDDTATIQALKELLEETKKQNETLNATINELKVANSKMALQIDANSVVTDEVLFSSFNKYKKG